MHKIKPKDFIALVTLLSILTLKLTNHNGDFDTWAALILGYYFGHRNIIVDKGL